MHNNILLKYTPLQISRDMSYSFNCSICLFLGLINALPELVHSTFSTEKNLFLC